MPKELYLVGAALAAIAAFALMKTGPGMETVQAAKIEKRLSLVEAVYAVAKQDRVALKNVLLTVGQKCAYDNDFAETARASKIIGQIFASSVETALYDKNGPVTAEQVRNSVRYELIQAIKRSKRDEGDHGPMVGALGIHNIHFDHLTGCTHRKAAEELTARGLITGNAPVQG
jgi:hypothetical protein